MQVLPIATVEKAFRFVILCLRKQCIWLHRRRGYTAAAFLLAAAFSDLLWDISYKINHARTHASNTHGHA